MRIAETNVSQEDWLFSMQLQNKNICSIVDKYRSGDKTIGDEYEIDNGRLFRRVGGKLLWVVPKALRWRIVQDQHGNAGHLSVEKTVNGLKKNFWFPRMRNVIKSHIKSCLKCAYNKSPGGKHEGEYHYDNINPIPFHTIHMDHLGPFPKSSRRNEHILVIVVAVLFTSRKEYSNETCLSDTKRMHRVFWRTYTNSNRSRNCIYVSRLQELLSG